MFTEINSKYWNSYLIGKGADLNRKTRAGHTPMDIALMYRNFEAAQLIELLSKEIKST